MTSLVDVIIEIPYNSYVKYEYDSNLNKIRCDRVLNTSMCYPGNYGYIPNTLSGDGDPLDILLVSEYPLYPGVVIKSRIIGVLLTEDEKGDDEKIIAVPAKEVDPSYTDVINYLDLPKITIKKIMHFFTHYKDNEENKWVRVKEFHDKEFAQQVYTKSRERYNLQNRSII